MKESKQEVIKDVCLVKIVEKFITYIHYPYCCDYPIKAEICVFFFLSIIYEVALHNLH